MVKSIFYIYKTKKCVCLFVRSHSPPKLLDGSGPNLAWTPPWTPGMSSTYFFGGTPTREYNFGKTKNLESFPYALNKIIYIFKFKFKSSKR